MSAQHSVINYGKRPTFWNSEPTLTNTINSNLLYSMGKNCNSWFCVIKGHLLGLSPCGMSLIEFIALYCRFCCLLALSHYGFRHIMGFVLLFGLSPIMRFVALWGLSHCGFVVCVMGFAAYGVCLHAVSNISMLSRTELAWLYSALTGTVLDSTQCWLGAELSNFLHIQWVYRLLYKQRTV